MLTSNYVQMYLYLEYAFTTGLSVVQRADVAEGTTCSLLVTLSIKGDLVDLNYNIHILLLAKDC